MSIWTHYLNNIEYHTGEFKLNGSGKAITGDAVTVGGGTEMYDIYSATDKHNHTIVGGGGKTVGISGYISGGGHSILAPRFGLAADQVLEMQVVTPRGEILTVNEDRHADLFWALGGVSTIHVTIAPLMLMTELRAEAQHLASLPLLLSRHILPQRSLRLIGWPSSSPTRPTSATSSLTWYLKCLA